MTNQQKLKKLFAYLQEIEAYDRSIEKLSFDKECTAPEAGMELAGNDMAVLGQRLFKLTHSKRYIALLTELYNDNEGLTDVQKKAIKKLFEKYKKEKNISAALSYKADLIYNKSYDNWLKAKKNKDFSLFKDSLTDAVDVTRQIISTREEQKETIYDTILNDYEEGGCIKQLDKFFADLKKKIIPLVKRISEEGKPIRDDFMSRPVPILAQEAFSRYLLELEGLEKSKLVLSTTEHPFTTHFSNCDVRVTTHYYEENFISNIFSTMHEGGHALFMQNEPDEFYKNHLADNMSNAMHECVSRFYENIIGKSEAFISFVMPKLRELSGNTFDDVSERELYEAVNIAKPGLNRMNSDELTYCIHIMIRYELEKGFVNGSISIDDIPKLWNKKYTEYLGVDVPDDEQGCLQDMHWTASYGYFPSYALGNAYGAQILHTMQKEFDVFEAVRKGDLDVIGKWMTERVFSHASELTPDEWIRSITGESLNTKYYTDYLENKFKKLYGLK